MPSSISSPALPSDAAAGAPLALDVRDLTGPAGAPFVRDVQLSVAPGERLIVLGPIDAGKSMLMRHVLGLERAQRGEVAVDGLAFDPTDPDEHRLREVRTHLGAVFESAALLRDISLVENVELPLLEHARARPARARDIARELLRETGIRLPDETLPGQLDRAGQRRVALARAVALRPALVLLDEPTAGLDETAAHGIDAIVDDLHRRYGFAVVIFTHEVRYAFRGARSIVVMHDGAVVARGSLDVLLQSDVPIVRRLLHRRGAA